MRLYLNDKVSRRLILHFLLAALIPMSGVAWYAYHQVSARLLETAFKQLKEDSKSFGMSLIETLNSDIGSLRQIARLPAIPTRNLFPQGFSAIERVPRPHLTVAQKQQLDRGEALLELAAGRPVELAVAIPGSGDILKGRLTQDALWIKDAAPERYCLFDADFEKLYCSPGLTPPDSNAIAARLGVNNSGVFQMQRADEAYLQGYWRPMYLATLGSRGFVVMVERPKADALRELDDFRQMFPKIALLALTLAATLAINQIRRQMKPLGELAEKTRQLAQGNLDTRVSVAGDDEFASLGRAFNDMAENLQYKFHMLGMLAELDRAILNASQIEYVILEVLNHIREAIPCDGAGLMTLGESGRAVLITCHEGRSLGCKRTPVGDYDLTQPDQTRDMIRIRPDSLTSDCLACLSSRPLAELLAFPVYGENRTEHVLVLAYAMPPRDVEGIAQSARALTDRLALAFSSFAQEEKLYHQAHYDALTDLPNRVLLRDRVEQALVRAGRNGTGVALILIDLDNFKQVNDLQGHSSGDMLLVKCAMRLKLKIRQEDTLARLGGDEFVILVEGLPRGEEVAILDGMLRKLGDSLSKPIALGERELVVTGSMGIALYPENASHFEELLKMADAAMYTSKRKQPGGFHFYTSDINSHSQRRFELTQELRQAVERDELTLHYQAKFDAETGHLVGAEALVRWNSPRRGLVLPGEFLQSLEEMGLGVWLGEWVLEHTCRQMRAWEDGGLPSIQISINLSPAQFERAQIVELVQANLDRYRVGAERLQIEILEATAVGSIKSVQDSLYRLHEMGISIALDDFGTGYSSLVYLTRIPANVLKLDRAFILTLADDKRQYEIVKRIISLAKVLDYSIVAEGVEDDTQRKLLAGMGCDHIQGYLCSRPIPADEFAEHWLAPLAAPTDQARFPRRAEGRTTSEFG